MGRAVTEFNQTHPNICVTQEDVGAGNPEYVAITNALKAGSGAPDVAEVEFDELPSFEVTKNVVNLVPYGANTYKSKFTTWAWDEVSQGAGVYAMPGDAGLHPPAACLDAVASAEAFKQLVDLGYVRLRAEDKGIDLGRHHNTAGMK